MTQAPKIFGTEGAQGDSLPEIVAYLGLIIILLEGLIILYYILSFIFKKNLILKWSTICFIYALIPLLIAFLFSNREDGGLLFLIPPFIFAGLTLYLSTIIMRFFYDIFSPNFSFSLAYNLLNLIIWLLIGMLIGWLIQKMIRAKRGKKK